MMTSTIVYCNDKPIKTTLREWMNTYIGRVSVGMEKDGYYEIIAYSDNQSDFPELHRIAKKDKAKYINSVMSEGVTTID